MCKTLKRIQQKYNVSDDVWLMIERYLYENIYQDSLDWVTNKKMHKDIARISKNDVYTMCQRNYGRIMLHLLRPTKLCPHFCDIGPDQKKLFIGGVEFHSDCSFNRSVSLECPYHVYKSDLLEAIRTNSKGRKIKGLSSMTKLELCRTLLTLDEFGLKNSTVTIESCEPKT